MNLGARTAAWSGGKLSAKSYVQDGLIAMWDGIENAGWGVHDASATTWKDLIGVRNLTLLNGNFGDNYLENPYTSQGYVGAQYDSLISDVVSAEVVYHWDYKFSNYGDACILGNSVNGFFVMTGPSGYPIHYIKTTSVRISLNFEDYNVATSASLDYSSYSAYINGQSHEMRTIGGSTSSPTCFCVLGRIVNANKSMGCKGKVFSIRLYSRSLSEREIKSNYAIDKARFGLT